MIGPGEGRSLSVDVIGGEQRRGPGIPGLESCGHAVVMHKNLSRFFFLSVPRNLS